MNERKNVTQTTSVTDVTTQESVEKVGKEEEKDVVLTSQMTSTGKKKMRNSTTSVKRSARENVKYALMGTMEKTIVH